jgi:hypothetical protein
MRHFLFEILLKLAGSDVDFVICGGLALFLQGGERATFDADLYIALSPENLNKAIDIFRKEGYTSRIPEPLESILDPENRKKWVEEKNALVYTLISRRGEVQVDIFLAYPIEYQTLAANSDIFEIEGKMLKVSSKEDLIEAKKAITPPREKDLFDIKTLEELLRNEERKDR